MTRAPALLSSAALACLREQVYLPDTCRIERSTRVRDAVGGMADTWATLATVACRVGPYRHRPGLEALFVDRVSSGVLWQVTLPAFTDVTARDRIVHAGRTLEVNAVLAPRSDEIVRFVICTGEV